MNFKSVISTIPVTILQDRDGDITGNIRITIKVADRLPDSDEIRIFTKDTLVKNIDTDDVSEQIIFNRIQVAQEKYYSVSYSDYDLQKEQLLQVFADEITELGISGSKIDDFLLIKKLLISLDENPIYGLTGAQWVAEQSQSEPINEGDEQDI